MNAVLQVARKHLLALGLVVLMLEVGIVAWHRLRSSQAEAHEPLNPSPSYVEIAPADRSQPIQIREARSIAVVISLFTEEELPLQDRGLLQCAHYEVVIPPAGAKSFTRRPVRVCEIGSEQFVWSHGDRLFRFDGDMGQVVKSLRARRIGQLLSSRLPQDRQVGKDLRERYREELVPALTALATSQNRLLRDFAISTLDEFNSEPPAVDGQATPGTGSEIADPTTKPVNGDFIKTLEKSVASLAGNALDRDALVTAQAGCRAIRQSDDVASAEAIVDLLRRTPDIWTITGELIHTVEWRYGLPAIYEQRAICGNSPPSAVRQFQAEEALRRQQALMKLLAWLDANAKKPKGERLHATLDTWRPTLTKLGETHGFYESYQPVPEQKLASLLRLGADLTAVVSEAQAKEAKLSERGMLEFVSAAVSGTCDEALVNDLLASDIHRRITACQIIAVAHKAGREQWTPILLKFLREPLPKNGVEAVVYLRAAAAETLFRIHGGRAVEDLRQAREAKFDNPVTTRILSHCFDPQ